MTTPTAGVTPSGASTSPLITSRSPGSDGTAMMPTELTPSGGAGVGGGPIWAATAGTYSREMKRVIAGKDWSYRPPTVRRSSGRMC